MIRRAFIKLIISIFFLVAGISLAFFSSPARANDCAPYSVVYMTLHSMRYAPHSSWVAKSGAPVVQFVNRRTKHYVILYLNKKTKMACITDEGYDFTHIIEHGV